MEPLVSICCITYNHKEYIRDALDGFLSQRTDFPYEILINDDASTDGTADIIRENLLKAGKKPADVEKLDLKDDVLRRANGFYTYFAADIAYHRNKFAVRGFDKVINIWGADHHGHVARLKGAIDALGLDGTNRLDIVLMQLVKLVRDGEVVNPHSEDDRVQGVRRFIEMMADDPRLTVTALQTVGSKGWDGFTLAWVNG